MDKKNIMPFHLFHYQGNHYVINIETMSTRSVDEITIRALNTISTEPEMLLTSGMEEDLKKLGLISDVKEKSTKTPQKEPFPIINMKLFLTQSCNLKCIYCYGDGGEYGAGGSSMQEKTAFQAVEWLLEQSGKMKRLYIGFLGGEPFLKFPLMKAIVEYAEKRVQEMGKEVDFDVITNGTLLDDEKITFIKEHQVSVMISFDGPKEVQDTQRPYANGEGSYDSTVPKLKKLFAALPDTPGHAVIVGNTDPRLVKDALQEIGFAEVSITLASKSLFTGESDRAKSERDTQSLLQTLEQESETWLRLTQNRDSEALKSLMVKSGLYRGLISLLHNSKRRYACGAGRGLVGVSSAGDVYLCHRFVGRDEYKLGSIFAKELNREEYQKSPTIDSAVCSVCFAKYYCAGGCKHDNASSCGSTTTPSEDMCRLSRRELELAATIICRLDPEDQAFLVGQRIITPKPCPLDF
ncbi:nif11-like peptide radical SAM maturase [Desulfosporosinus fructosivorans]|uniref:Nif11-like peptide radical SAM maturase n=1 Tax=Desulfosporosinus fructosivorans TaxID=2018669 RepID=A0A4Z0R2K2_9FIRM|nr:nif11-like peptide radical SAM maturase [Desulfosporosinus fructosivorans]TGE36585.1 nif11-like peptide radical SAM maturase [Desulfosporosinus fructosivorans]